MSQIASQPRSVGRHYHVAEANVGCLPETEAYTTADADEALDYAGGLLGEWAEANPDHAAAGYATGVAELYRAGCRAPEHDDLVWRLDRDGAVAEHVGLRVVQVWHCSERGCLAHCATPGCPALMPADGPNGYCPACQAEPSADIRASLVAERRPAAAIPLGNL